MIRLVILSMITIFSLSLMAQEETPTIVEEMPTFLGCENDTISPRKCTETALLRYLYKNFKYPSIARKNGIEGLIVLTFVVNTEGQIEGAKTLKEPSEDLGDEAIRVIETMNEGKPKWKPGKQRGEKVKVRYNIPIRFTGR